MAYPKTFPHHANLWSNNQAALSELIFVIVVAVWGITFVFTKNALEVIGPFAYNTVRMTLGAITLTALAGHNRQGVDKRYVWPSLVTGFILFLAYATQAYGQQFTTASKAGFLTGTNVVYVPLLSALLLRRRPRQTSIVGVVLAFAGLFLLSVDVDSLSLASGDFWVALSGLGWGVYIITLAHYSSRLQVMTYAALHVFVAALLSGVCWLFVEPIALPFTSTALWMGVVSTGFFVIGLGTGVQTWVTRVASPTRVALIAALEPVFAAGAGWWIGEAVTLKVITGGILIVMGMLIAELGHLLQGRNGR